MKANEKLTIAKNILEQNLSKEISSISIDFNYQQILIINNFTLFSMMGLIFTLYIIIMENIATRLFSQLFI